MPTMPSLTDAEIYQFLHFVEVDSGALYKDVDVKPFIAWEGITEKKKPEFVALAKALNAMTPPEYLELLFLYEITPGDYLNEELYG